MSPMTGSEYENYGFDKNEQGKVCTISKNVFRTRDQSLFKIAQR